MRRRSMMSTSEDVSTTNYLTFTTDGSNKTISLVNNGNNNPVVYYSHDKETWNTLSTSAVNFNDNGQIYINGSNPNGFSFSATQYTSFSLGGTGNVSCSGSAMSLLNKDQETTTIPCDFCFNGLFENCSSLISVSSNLLPATTLKSRCYRALFMKSGINSIPSGLLPATTLVEKCYVNMFQNCSAVTSVPNGLLPATILTEYCYASMFQECSNLVSIPEGLLPATSLATSCYDGMFAKCGLRTVPDGLLPATTLATSCYQRMFFYNTNLTNLPDLPASNLVTTCYKEMAYGDVINRVKCLATNPSSSFTTNWLYGSSSIGTFTQKNGVTWQSGASGIPSGWTIIYVS